MTTAELTQLFNLFTEALNRLSTDKSEVQLAAEALSVAQAALAKEEGDVGGSTESLVAAAGALKSGIDDLVAGLTGG